MTGHASRDAFGKAPSAEAIRLLILDVDGVMTDGSIVLDHDGREHKRFHVRDGFGIKLWQRLGFTVAIITGRSGEALRHRAAELAITHVIQGSSDKAASLADLLASLQLAPAHAAFLGDDWPDLAPLRLVAYPMAVADADPHVLALARYVTRAAGGHGAVREAVEHLIASKGLLERALAQYD
ncbi:MAG: KdsC family phosphatase [Phycisphaerales bacterium]